MENMDESYKRLIQEAREVITLRFKQDHHHIGAALITTTGKVYRAVHVEAYVGRVTVCAEAVAIGMAAADGDTEIAAIVAVDRHGRIVAPCGLCREMISDYAPNAKVILAEDQVVPILDLLPFKYVRNLEAVVGFDPPQS